MAHMRFYVYEHYKKKTGEVFYVGKGTGFRVGVASKEKRSEFWWNTTQKYEWDYRIVKRFYSPICALAYERMLIGHYGRRDLGTGPLVNLTDGGEGNIQPPKIKRLKLRTVERQIIKYDLQGKFVAVYLDATEAGASVGKKSTNIHNVCKKECNICGHFTFRYHDTMKPIIMDIGPVYSKFKPKYKKPAFRMRNGEYAKYYYYREETNTFQVRVYDGVSRHGTQLGCYASEDDAKGAVEVFKSNNPSIFPRIDR